MSSRKPGIETGPHQLATGRSLSTQVTRTPTQSRGMVVSACRRSIWLISLVLSCALLLSACGGGTNSGSSSPDDPSGSNGTDVSQIQSVLEEQGLLCEPKENHPKQITQAIECKGDRYLIMTANEFESPTVREEELRGSPNRHVCSEGLLDRVNWAVSGPWAIVPGDDTDEQLDFLTGIADELGFDMVGFDCDDLLGSTSVDGKG